MRGDADESAAGYVPISEAARRLGRSVRTVQRRIAEGRLETIPDPTDRRQRLVRLDAFLADVDRLSFEIARAYSDHEGALREEVDAVLAAAQDHVLDLAGKLGWRPAGDFTAAELRASALGRDLRLLCEAARGEVFNPPDYLAMALDRVLRALFPDPFDGPPTVPAAFWTDSLLGQELARARLLAHSPDRLVSLNEAVAATGLTRSRAENALRAVGADRFYDPDAGQWRVHRAAVAAAREWAAGPAEARIAAEAAAEPTPNDGEAAVTWAGARRPRRATQLTGPAAAQVRRRSERVRRDYHRMHFRTNRP